MREPVRNRSFYSELNPYAASAGAGAVPWSTLQLEKTEEEEATLWTVNISFYSDNRFTVLFPGKRFNFHPRKLRDH